MGISTVQIQRITCDLCHEECGANDGVIQIEVTPGDGRDVGAGYIRAAFRLDIPWGVSGGIICKKCKMEHLARYVKAGAD